MAKHRYVRRIIFLCLLLLLTVCHSAAGANEKDIGREVAIAKHMQDGEEFRTPVRDLIAYGKKLFTAMWTIQEGAGRPMSKGTGMMLTDLRDPLLFPRNFNRISGPDSNSCSGCHNKPYVGGGGDIIGNVFVLGQRFDFATFNHSDTTPTKGSADERGAPITLQSMANSRKT